MKHQAVHLQGVSSFPMEKTCSLFKENYLHFFLHLIKTPGPGAGKAVRGWPWGQGGLHLESSGLFTLGEPQGLAWAGETLFGCRCTDTFSLSLALFSPEPQIPGAFWGLLVAIVSWWLWAGAYTQPWGQVVWSRVRCVFLQLREVCYGVTALWDIWRVIGRKVKGRAFVDHLASVRNGARYI